MFRFSQNPASFFRVFALGALALFPCSASDAGSIGAERASVHAHAALIFELTEGDGSRTSSGPLASSWCNRFPPLAILSENHSTHASLKLGASRNPVVCSLAVAPQSAVWSAWLPRFRNLSTFSGTGLRILYCTWLT